MKISGPTGFQSIIRQFNIYLGVRKLAANSQSALIEITATGTETTTAQAETLDYGEAYLRIREKLADLDKALGELHTTSETIRPRLYGSPVRRTSASVASNTAAEVTSASDLGDLATGTAAVMRSTEEVNTTPTSFSSFGPTWTGSTAQATIGGDYDGSNGSTTLTFKVDREGTHGEDNVTIKVYNANNQVIDQIDIDKKNAIDQPYTLSNGLILTLGAGDLLANDTFTLDVDDSMPPSSAPSLPQWEGSTALASLDGVYDGSNGSMTLTFKVDRDGTHGADDVRIKVFDANNQVIDQIDIDNEHPIDQQYTLSNGLVFTLGDGDLLENTTFTVDVYDAIGSAVDPAKPLNGTRNDNPTLEYGLSVTDGSFELNGTTIVVYASDTINEVLDRITQSDAGVSAAFDADTETVVLTQKTLGSMPTIVLGNDTSGFLAAMKLESAASTPGTAGDLEKPMVEVARFSSVQSGSVSVNGIDIAIDKNVDSLNDVLARINASAAGVTASLDDTAHYVTFVSNDPSQPLVLDSGGTGFFPALEIPDDTYQPTQTGGRAPQTSERRISQWDASQFTQAIENVAEALNTLFEEQEPEAVFDPFFAQLRQKIQTVIQQSFDSGGAKIETMFGIHFDFRDTDKPMFNFSEYDRSRLESALIHEGHGLVGEIDSSFFDEPLLDRDGLATGLTSALIGAESDLKSALGQEGDLLPDVWA